uniref:Uncharacterized protein n=1 Tax=Vannella robusta TaxID=1487602 RepID=A0A7S4MNG3_9EUKA|mmetsp:Transcript_417/g.552  ORF Transcript_417/g.552 Transcript_417/m.552 type:complete len:107 (+) Transcript_417:26-346(+)
MGKKGKRENALRKRKKAGKEDQPLSWFERVLEKANEKAPPLTEQEMEDDIQAEQILHDMLTSVNFVICMSVITVFFIVFSMYTTMIILGIDGGLASQKHIMNMLNL